MIEEDAILEKLERIRNTKTIMRFFKDPKEVILENPIRLGYLSAAIGAVLMIIIAIMNVEFFAPGDAYILAGIAAFILPVYYLYTKEKIIRRGEDALPELLRDLAQSKLSGLSLVDAFTLTADGEYGQLTETLRRIAALLTWGVPFERAMTLLAKEFPTPMIKRSVMIIIEGYRVGGEIGLILKVAADDAMELKTLGKRKVAEMAPYIIICYVTYFVFLAILMALYNWLIPMMVESSSAATGMPGMGRAIIPTIDVETPRMLFFHCAVIQGICSGLVAGKLGSGTVIAGLPHALILAGLSVVFFAMLNFIAI